MPSYKGITKETMLEAIKNSQGIISTIAKRLGCDSKTAERLVHKWADTDQAYHDEVNFVLDLAESKIIKAINDGDVKTCKWYLSMKGRERGYDNTQVLKVDNGKPLNINLSGANSMTKEDLEKATNVEIGGAGVEE